MSDKCPKCGSELEAQILPIGVELLACVKTAKRKKPSDGTTLCDYYEAIPEPEPPSEYEQPTVTELDAPDEETFFAPEDEESIDAPDDEDIDS